MAKWMVILALVVLVLVGALLSSNRSGDDDSGDTLLELDPSKSVTHPKTEPQVESPDDVMARIKELQEDIDAGDVRYQEAITPHTTPRFTRHESRTVDFGPIPPEYVDDASNDAGEPANVGVSPTGGVLSGAVSEEPHPLDNPPITEPVTGDGPLSSGVPQVNTGLLGPGQQLPVTEGALEGDASQIRPMLPGPRGEMPESVGTAPADMGVTIPGEDDADSDLVGPAEGPGGSLERRPPGN